MEKFDVVIIGAGSAGSIAAIASARMGAKTLLIDEKDTVGGTNVRGLVGPLTSFIGEKGDVICGGIPQELIDRLIKENACIGHINDPIGFCHSLTPIDFKMMQITLFQMIDESKNITLRLNEELISSKVIDNKITSITTIDSNSKEHIYEAKVFIDASGDADLVAISNIKYTIGRKEDGMCQPMTTIFSLGNVNLDKVKEDVKNNPENFVISEDVKKNGMGYVAISGYFKEVQESNNFPVGRDRLLFFEGTNKGEVFVNTTRICGYSSIDKNQNDAAIKEGNKQVYDLYKWLKENIEAFKDSYILDIGTLGVRESRRLIGKKTLTADDILNGRKQNKSIAIGSYPIDIHSPDSSKMNFVGDFISHDYEIDYDMCISEDVDNMLVAGRIISATHEAHASSRVTATCMSVGQSVGIAAALLAKNDSSVDEINIDELKICINNIGGITDIS